MYCETAAKEIFMIDPVALIMLYSFSLQNTGGGGLGRWGGKCKMVQEHTCAAVCFPATRRHVLVGVEGRRAADGVGGADAELVIGGGSQTHHRLRRRRPTRVHQAPTFLSSLWWSNEGKKDPA